MDIPGQIEEVTGILERVGVQPRRERLGGNGGGLCRLKGRRVLFVDLDADAATQLEGCLRALGSLAEADQMFLPPHIREGIDRVRLGK